LRFHFCQFSFNGSRSRIQMLCCVSP
jgi:hypothetical protein